MSDDQPIDSAGASYEAELRAFRARHRQFFEAAPFRITRIAESLYLLRLAVGMRIHRPRGEIHSPERAVHERRVRELEQTFCAWRAELQASACFSSLTESQQKALSAECCEIDFEHDPLDRDPFGNNPGTSH